MNPSDLILYILAFVGLWHMIGIPPVIKWGIWRKKGVK